MAHSIPDSVALVIETGAGRVVHTGDWKLDHTPVDGLKTDVGKLAEIGNRGVDLLLGDSTNAERPGSTGSERLVGEAFRTLFPLRRGRSWSRRSRRTSTACSRRPTSPSSRPQDHRHRPLDAEEPEHRAEPRLRGHPRIRDRLPGEAAQLEPHQVLALCTGSQGEPMSALTRIAYGDHPALTVEPETRSSSPRSPCRKRAPRPRLDQPAGGRGRSSTRRSRRCTSRGTRARRSSERCSRCSARAT